MEGSRSECPRGQGWLLSVNHRLAAQVRRTECAPNGLPCQSQGGPFVRMNSLTTFSGLRLADAEPTVFRGRSRSGDVRVDQGHRRRDGTSLRSLRHQPGVPGSIRPDRPGCLVLEIRIPGGNGLQIQKQLKDMGAALPIVFLTASRERLNRRPCDAHGGLALPGKAVARARSVGGHPGGDPIDRQRRKAKSIEEQVVERLRTLSEKELAVLKLLADCKSKTAMAQELEVSVRTIEYHRTQLMRKLKTNSRQVCCVSL